MLPNLEKLLWYADDAVAVAVLRRAVSLRAVDVSHASARAAVAAGPVADIGSSGNPCTFFAPFANVQMLALYAVGKDAASLSKTLAAAPHASTIELDWGPFGPRPWDVLRTVASAASGENLAGRCRVRRVRIGGSCRAEYRPDPDEAARCIRAVFPRARYASFCVDELPDVQLLPPQSP
jgi:hypothetical protein